MDKLTQEQVYSSNLPVFADVFKFCVSDRETIKEPILEVLKESSLMEMAFCSQKDAYVPHQIYGRHKRGDLDEAAKFAVGENLIEIVQK